MNKSEKEQVVAELAERLRTSDTLIVTDYRGLARRSPWLGAVLVIALTGLAGLPPGLAGLFAKVTVVRALLGGDAAWLAVVVALNAVIGVIYAKDILAIGPDDPRPWHALIRAAAFVPEGKTLDRQVRDFEMPGTPA